MSFPLSTTASPLWGGIAVEGSMDAEGSTLGSCGCSTVRAEDDDDSNDIRPYDAPAFFPIRAFHRPNSSMAAKEILSEGQLPVILAVSTERDTRYSASTNQPPLLVVPQDFETESCSLHQENRLWLVNGRRFPNG